MFGIFKKKKQKEISSPHQDVPPALGWIAIEQAFKALYPGQEPRHLGATIYRMDDISDKAVACDGYSIYDAGDFWHYVSYGLSDLYTKSNNSEQSGFGFEFTMRIGKHSESEPPRWPVSVIESIAKAQWQGEDFSPGHTISTGPIDGNPENTLTALFVVHDPDLPLRETPHGTLAFYLLHGITENIRSEAKELGNDIILKRLQNENPAFITNVPYSRQMDWRGEE
jgi:hypothetical protein